MNNRPFGLPFRWLVTLALYVFLAEGLVMLVFTFFPPMLPWVEGPLDAFLVTVMTLPALYAFLYRPMHKYIQDMETAKAKLEKEVEEHKQTTEALRRSQSQLIQAEKMTAVGLLASGIAHEVKNPLGIVMQGVDCLGQEPPIEGDERREILEEIKNAILRADRIIRGLLRFARPARLERKSTDLKQVIEESLVLAEKQFLVKDIEVIKEFADPTPSVTIDENQMEQVLINLILNAFQAMQGGGKLYIRCRVDKLTAGQAAKDGMAEDRLREGDPVLICEIQDTGKGITADELSKIFDPFFTTKTVGVGVGLGLSVSRTIVEQHRGIIFADSEKGQGTLMTVILPLDPD
ncbi:MAG: ATP-binding protein [Candidatus Omnitrophota bacterium]|nr:ATP-binding protein [Candidatus Omnitrophota bacterium]